MRRTQWWSDWRYDLRFAIRQLTVSPLLTAVLVLTIALGIGSTVAIFSVLNAVLLRPLAADDSERIVYVVRDLATVSSRECLGRPLPRLDRTGPCLRAHGGRHRRNLQLVRRRARAGERCARDA